MRARAASLAPILALIVLASPSAAWTGVLIEFGSTMRYLANGSDPGPPASGWMNESYDDAAWPAGVYGVGYEAATGAEALLATTVPASTRSVFTRARFWIDDVSSVLSLSLGADFDDGYVAWVNGTRVACSAQMPTCDPPWDASAALHESSNGAVPNYAPLLDIYAAALPVLHQGWNVLAIGVWNNGTTSSDLVLVPQLVANSSSPLARGPYLQRLGSTGVVLRWRTSAPSNSRVRFGPSPGNLANVVDDQASTLEHEVALTGLAPETTYYYSVGTTAAVLAGGDSDHAFHTAPPAGATGPIRVWVIGDSGTADAGARAVRDAYKSFAGSTPTDLWLMLGDNAYPSGTDAEYQAAVFDTYPEMLRKSPLFPTFGNHDAVSAISGTQSGPYYDMFTLPTSGELGGQSSVTEAYYSFEYGNVHFLCLNSQDVDLSPGGAFQTWLAQDLMNNTADWTVAYWHHPPYTKGSHDSDNPIDSGGRMLSMRQLVLPVLESWGVDLVLTGHSHSYERSFLLDGHYGTSITLTSAMILDGGDGRIGGDGAYQKAGAGPVAHEGAVHVVAGSSGQTSGGSLNHPAMVISLNRLGSLVLDVTGDRLDARFLSHLGVVEDQFALVKNTAAPPQADFAASPTSGVAPLSVAFTDLSSTNTAAWSWDLDGDTFPDSAQPAPSHVYTTAGRYTVRLTASNAAGSDVETKTDLVCVAASAGPAVANLTFTAAGDTLSWEAPAGAVAYDLVRGNLVALRAAGGDFAASSPVCLGNDDPSTQATDMSAPGAGGAFYYLVRSLDCQVMGSYDEGVPSQVGSRDPGLSSPPACP